MSDEPTRMLWSAELGLRPDDRPRPMRVLEGPCDSCGQDVYRDVREDELNTKDQNIEFRKQWDARVEAGKS